MEEVAKATDYTGSKMDESSETRDRIAMTDDDMENLNRFWEEAANAANDRLKTMIVDFTSAWQTQRYQVTLEVSKSFDKTLTPTVESSLRSFFILSIVGKWFQFTNKKEASSYLAEAAEMLEDVMRKLYTRRRPTSPRNKS